MEEQKSPRIRFSDFSNKWNQKQLNNFADYTSSSLTAKDSNEEGLYDLYDANGIIGKTNSKCMEQEYLTVIKDGAGVGRIRLLPKKTMFIGTMGAITPAGCDIHFLQALLTKADLGKAHTGSTIPHIYFKDYGNNKYFIPDIEEQKKIGNCLALFDNNLELHKSKLECIKDYKTCMLQKLFPKEGQFTPEVRFQGFSDNWKELNLGSLYTERNEKGNDHLQFLTVSIHSGVSDKELDSDDLGKIVKRSEDKSTYKHVYEGDLVFNMMRAWQGAIGVAKSEGMISPAYISAIPNNEVFPLFMDYALRRKATIEQINNLSYGVTDFRKRLYWNSFVKVKCMIPSKEEQEKIWRFLKQIDDIIDLYQQKIKAMTEYKKGLLQQMFI